MTTSPVSENVNDFAMSAQTKWTSVLIGVLAVLLAICTMGGDNSAKDAAKANLDASNNWAFFQAKNIRRTAVDLAADELDLVLLREPELAPAARAAIEAKIKEYRERSKRFTSEPDKKEGLDELFVRGKELEAARDAALARDPYFDWGQAFLQIAIVLASVSIVAASRPLLFAGMGLGLLGTLAMVNGFFLLF